MKYIEVTDKTVEDAITKACLSLEVPSDRLDIIVVSEGSRGFFGIGNKPAIIKVAKKEDEKQEKSADDPTVTAKAQKEPVKKSEEKTEHKTETQEETIKKRKRPKKKKKHNKENSDESKHEEKNLKDRIQEKKEPVVKSEEEISLMKSSAEEFLKAVINVMNIPIEFKMEYIEDDGCLEIDLIGDDTGVLIGKRGQTLDSLQYLTGLVVNKKQKPYVRIKLDTEDYRRRRRETLENLAKNIAGKVKKTRKTVVLEPMNPYERRIIHSTLQQNRFVETYSEGNEPYRHVVIALKKQIKNFSE